MHRSGEKPSVSFWIMQRWFQGPSLLDLGLRRQPGWQQDTLIGLALGPGMFLAILLLSIPWLFANLGYYAGDVPGLRRLFMSEQIVPEPGYPHLRAVHLGNHEGIDGVGR